MKNDGPGNVGPRGWIIVWGVGMGSVAMLALALCTRYFQPWLSADYIYPQLFAEDLLAGRYPLSGWTLSSAPYFFPDMAVITLLRAIGGNGTALPAYVVFSYLSLAIVAGWSLQRLTRAGGFAWLAGVALVDGLLLWQPVGDHAHYLWLFGTVGFHGGAILLGLVNVAIWAGREPDETMPLLRWRVAIGILFLGLMSDTLFLVQAVLPLGIGLWAQAGWKWPRPLVKGYTSCLGWAVGWVVVVRLALWAGGWFSFSKVFRYLPTPSGISTTTTSFVRDLTDTLGPGAWGFGALAMVSLAISILFWWRDRRDREKITLAKPAIGFVVIGLAATTAMPLITTYWRDANHVRYLLPWLVIPGWFGLSWVLPKLKPLGPLSVILSGLGFAGVAGVAVTHIDPAKLHWPYPARQAALDQFLESRKLRHGFSDYWHAHEINTLAHSPVHLFPLRPDGRFGFWNNNAFWFFQESSGRLLAPRYNFVIVDGLDEAVLKGKFGEPTEKVDVEGTRIWLYSEAAAGEMTRQGEAAVKNYVRDRPGSERIESAL